MQEFQAQATENRERTVEVPAPRGMILDRKGRPLVRNRPGDRITFDLQPGPRARRRVRPCGPTARSTTRPEETVTAAATRPSSASLEALPKEGAEAARRSASRPPAPPSPCACGRAARKSSRRARAAGAAHEDAAGGLRGRDPLRAHPLAVRAGHAAHGRAARARLLPQGARAQLPGRAHPARLRALLPEPGGRRPPVRRARADLRRAARGRGGVPRRRGGRHGRRRRHRAHVRPLPARPRRRAAAARRRAGQPGGHGLRLAARPSPAPTSG